MEKIFGVKLREKFVAVEEADLLGDISKYDFLLKDSLVRSYNANDDYLVEVMTETGKDAIINGWKLHKIEMPGNWSGQSTYFYIEDKYEDVYRSKKPVLENVRYSRQPVRVIRDTLLGVLNFTKENHSAKYARVTEGLNIPSACYSIDDLYIFSQQVERYIQEYRDVQKLLKKEESSEYETHLTQCFLTQLSKCFSFEIKKI